MTDAQKESLTKLVEYYRLAQWLDEVTLKEDHADAIDAALAEIDRLTDARRSAFDEAWSSEQDAILKAAKAGWALAIERLRQAIRFSQGKMPLTAEECVTILENSDLPIVLPEKRRETP